MEETLILIGILILSVPIITMVIAIRTSQKLNDVLRQLTQLKYKVHALNFEIKPDKREVSVVKNEPISKPMLEKSKVEKIEEIKKPSPMKRPEVLLKTFEPSKKTTVSRAPKTQKTLFERYPDLERFIGENLLSKIGIVIFVIGMGFLVKLGIDSGVITEVMRVAIGITIGGALIGIAHFLRKTMVKFSSVLIGGALSVLYFSIALAFHDYQLIPQSAAFINMVIITLFGALLAIGYNRRELAVLALLGGFGTPFFVDNGQGNVITLLSYVHILDLGMLLLSYFKKWSVINYLCFGFSLIIFVMSYQTEFIFNYGANQFPLLIFLTAFYLIFFLMNVVYNVKNNKQFRGKEIMILLTNSAVYFGFGLSLVNAFYNGIYSGVFVALIAVFNFIFAYRLFHKKGIDKNLLFVLIGVAFPKNETVYK